jgi:serine/threonine-protein kinase
MDAVVQLNNALQGRYDIDREIGAGGMATVYLARDVKHDRKVALKVLKPELGVVLGVERFLAEIKVTANLQHPNLLPLFDSGAADGLLFYVMPYVEGESLRARLEREKQLPIDVALHIATSVASALDYAHRHGVIHRDLKPENILLHEGQPVVADFGIALAVANAGGNRITQTGLSLGTPQYMSPEQATGDRAIDGRTDIYSLAAMLYEMLGGDPPHTGSTAQAIIARVLTDKPRSVRANRDMVPAHVDAALERGLAKLPADRFATAREFSEALTGSRSAAFAVGGMAASQTDHDVRFTITLPKEKIRVMARWAAVGAIVGVGAWGWLRPQGTARTERARFTVMLPDSLRLREDLGGQNVALSPDGSQLVYAGGSGQGQLYLRPLNELESHPIRGTEKAVSPRFSPDGNWLAFVVAGSLKKIAMSGGPAVAIVDSVNRPSWGDGDVIVFDWNGGGRARRGLWMTTAGGGTPERLTTLDSTRHETDHTWPSVLPGGKSALFTVEKGGIQSSELAAVRFDDHKVIRLGLQGANPRYVAGGFILYGRLDGTLVAAPFDLKRLRVTGPAVTVLEGIVVKGGGATEIGVSNNGTLAFSGGSLGRQLVLVDRSGLARPLLEAQQRYDHPRFSPSGDRVAVQIAETGGSTRSDVWIYDIALRQWTRVTRDGKSVAPEWSADGQRIAWLYSDSSGREVRWTPSDGSGIPQTLLGRTTKVWSFVFSPAGRLFVGTREYSDTSDGMFIGVLDSAAKLRPVARSKANEWDPRFSPDGRWLAYSSTESGEIEVYVTSVAGSGAPYQISTAGGSDPRWAPDGRTLYYRTGSLMMAASVVTSPGFRVTQRDSLFADSYEAFPWGGRYDITRDGKNFLMLRAGDGTQRAVVVFGWLDELRERMKIAAKK